MSISEYKELYRLRNENKELKLKVIQLEYRIEDLEFHIQNGRPIKHYIFKKVEE